MKSGHGVKKKRQIEEKTTDLYREKSWSFGHSMFLMTVNSGSCPHSWHHQMQNGLKTGPTPIRMTQFMYSFLIASDGSRGN
jgi:hypothetical protein